LQDQASNHRKLLAPKAQVVGVAGKGVPLSTSGTTEEDERK
jgi:hypothetical protein